MEDQSRERVPVGSDESTLRDDQAAERDRSATDRDVAATDRDAEADERDRVAGRHDLADGSKGPSKQSDREAASVDRELAAADRLQAAADREAAATDRDWAAGYSDSLLLDTLTGLYRRGAGLIELEREIRKARRTEEPFTLAFIDVDHLKETNDTHGHNDGDLLLQRVAAAIRDVVRDYDVVARYGGDEFICGTPGLGLAEAQRRLDAVNHTLAATGGGTASIGVVQLQDGETLDHAISRADAAMYLNKHNRGGC